MTDTIDGGVQTSVDGDEAQDILAEIWQSVFEDIRREVDIPTVWLAMQESVPLAIQETKFVVGLPKASFYLSINLQVTQTRIAIERALERGRRLSS